MSSVAAFQSKIQDAVPTTIARTIRAAAIVNALALALWPILAPITPSALWSDISPSVLVLKISPAIPTSTAIKFPRWTSNVDPILSAHWTKLANNKFVKILASSAILAVTMPSVVPNNIDLFASAPMAGVVIHKSNASDLNVRETMIVHLIEPALLASV